MTDCKQIKITRRKNARNVTVRRCPDATYKATIPYRMTPAEAEAIIFNLIKRIEKERPCEWQQKYFEDQIISVDRLNIRIIRQNVKPDKVIGISGRQFFTIGVGANLMWGQRETDLAINRLLLAYGRSKAREILLAEAARTALAIGVGPTYWTISHGHRTLGSCHADGHISLSHILVYLEPELRQYIFYHELAHLSEMNHSKRFHEICDSYCNGQEKTLSTRLRNYAWPILR